MKKALATLSFLLIAASGAQASLTRIDPAPTPSLSNAQTAYLHPSRMISIEWGCPVADVVRAKSPSEAVEKISKECRETVAKAASEKPNVVDVIKTSVIWPDVAVSRSADGYSLTGTFFLETVVLERGDK